MGRTTDAQSWEVREPGHLKDMVSVRYLFAVVLGVIAGLGCSQISRPEQAALGEQTAADTFLHEHLQSQSMVTTAEAYRAMVLLAEGNDELTSFAAREELLLAREIVRREWKLKRDQVVDRGTVAYMVMKILGLPGGVNVNVMGRMGIGDRRYALRELIYHDVMANGPPYRFISGAELVDVLGRADEVMAREGLYADEPADVVESLTSRPAAGS